MASTRRDKIELWEQKLEELEEAAASYEERVETVYDQFQATWEEAQRAYDGDLDREEAEAYVADRADAVEIDPDTAVQRAAGDGITTAQAAQLYGDDMEAYHAEADAIAEEYGDFDGLFAGLDRGVDFHRWKDTLATKLGKAHEFMKNMHRIDEARDEDGYRFRGTSVEEKKEELRRRYTWVQETCAGMVNDVEQIRTVTASFPDALETGAKRQDVDWETAQIMDEYGSEYSDAFGSEAAMRAWVRKHLANADEGPSADSSPVPA